MSLASGDRGGIVRGAALEPLLQEPCPAKRGNQPPLRRTLFVLTLNWARQADLDEGARLGFGPDICTPNSHVLPILMQFWRFTVATRTKRAACEKLSSTRIRQVSDEALTEVAGVLIGCPVGLPLSPGCHMRPLSCFPVRDPVQVPFLSVPSVNPIFQSQAARNKAAIYLLESWQRHPKRKRTDEPW